MTFGCADETNCFLAPADDIEIIVKIQPQPSPKALGADESPPQTKPLEVRRGMAPPEGSGGERAFARGSLLIFQRWKVDILKKVTVS